MAVSEVVARGAAIHAGIVAAQNSEDAEMLDPDVREALGGVVEINVNSHSLGIEIKQAQERINDILIPKNTQLPTAASRVYRTVVRTNRGCGSRCCRARPPRPTPASASASAGSRVCRRTWPKGSPVQVRCGVGSNGLIDVMALDMTSGKMARTEIHRSQRLVRGRNRPRGRLASPADHPLGSA